jgi:hypothetical protein
VSATDKETALTLLPFVPPCRYLRLLNLRDCYYAGGGFLDHVDDDRFDLGFIPWSFFRTAFFLAARRGLAPATVGFVAFPRADLETLRALPARLLRGLARFFGWTFARFFRSAMIIPPSLLCAALILP